MTTKHQRQEARRRAKLGRGPTCIAHTWRGGRRCSNSSQPGSDLCGTHARIGRQPIDADPRRGKAS